MLAPIHHWQAVRLLARHPAGDVIDLLVPVASDLFHKPYRECGFDGRRFLSA